MAPDDLLRVEVAYSADPGHMDLVPVVLNHGASLSDALTASGLLARHGLQQDQLRVGIWGKAKDLSTALRESDRVEIYRPLRVDPKEARRQRYRKDRPARKAVPA
jgi:putative ubiquitin-RnfH superfamily antitoxin RatB of RatAB toxin-antitoxin module